MMRLIYPDYFGPRFRSHVLSNQLISHHLLPQVPLILVNVIIPSGDRLVLANQDVLGDLIQ